MAYQFSADTKKNLALWLEGTFCDQVTKNKIRDLIASKPEEIENSFYTSLEFGTGGLRGLMGFGPNRMNIYTIQETSLGIALYLLSFYRTQKSTKQPSAVIGYDSRNHSKEFALETARVFAGVGIHAYLFDDISPTPLVSFACRHLHADIAVMITASHNPPEYNGYKVYWSYGGQVLPPHDIGMMKEVERVRAEATAITLAPKNSVDITSIGSEIDEAYIDVIRANALWKNENKSSLRPLYSALHGTGGRLMAQALQAVGVDRLFFVAPQMIPDGSFPTVKQPNPEDPKALKMGIDLLVENKYDIFIASDPDADRLGAVVLHKNNPVILSGNQIAAIMAEWIVRRLHETNRLPSSFGLVKSCVTTNLIDAIAKQYGAHLTYVLPGFKYIAEVIENWQHLEKPITYVFGAEESYGTLYGLHARDKDAISSGTALCEIAWHLKQEGKTLIDALDELYRMYGYYYEGLETLSYEESKEGRLQMRAVLEKLRLNPPKEIQGIPVIAWQDLLLEKMEGEKALSLPGLFPKSNVISISLEDGSRIIIRPSGTEPKVKIYFFLYSPESDQKSRAMVEKKYQKLRTWNLS